MLSFKGMKGGAGGVKQLHTWVIGTAQKGEGGEQRAYRARRGGMGLTVTHYLGS